MYQLTEYSPERPEFGSFYLVTQTGEHVFETDTDTETIAHLIAARMNGGNDPVAAVKSALTELEGAFALSILFEGHVISHSWCHRSGYDE